MDPKNLSDLYENVVFETNLVLNKHAKLIKLNRTLYSLQQILYRQIIGHCSCLFGLYSLLNNSKNNLHIVLVLTISGNKYK